MKKFLIFILFLLLINVVNAEDPALFSILRNSYNAQETLQAELRLSVNLVNKVTESNFFLSDENNNVIPIALFLEDISKSYYFAYFNIPNLQPGAYNFEAKDIRYIDNADGLLKQYSIKKTFVILNQTSDTSSISISPGIILSNGKLELKNNLNPINITINAPPNANLSKVLFLMDKVLLDVKLLESNYNIEILYGNKKYIIPVLTNQKPQENVLILTPPKNSVIFLNSSLGKTFPKVINLNKNQSLRNPLYAKNVWNLPIYNLTIKITGDLKDILNLEENKVSSLDPNETTMYFVLINTSKYKKETYTGDLTIYSNQDILSSLTFNINLFNKLNLTNLTIKDEVRVINFTNYTNTPLPQDSNSPSSFIKIFLIVAVLIVAVYFIFRKKIKKEESFEEHFYRFKKP